MKIRDVKEKEKIMRKIEDKKEMIERMRERERERGDDLKV